MLLTDRDVVYGTERAGENTFSWKGWRRLGEGGSPWLKDGADLPCRDGEGTGMGTCTVGKGRAIVCWQ